MSAEDSWSCTLDEELLVIGDCGWGGSCTLERLSTLQWLFLYALHIQVTVSGLKRFSKKHTKLREKSSGREREESGSEGLGVHLIKIHYMKYIHS